MSGGRAADTTDACMEQQLTPRDLEAREADALRMALEAVGCTPSGRHPLAPQVRAAPTGTLEPLFNA